MGIKRKITLFVAFALFAACLIIGLCTVSYKASAYTERIEITSNTGDTFKTVEASFGENDSFVFSATVNFNNGDAAALTFGGTEDGLWAFNIDRVGNRVKLLYFTKTEEGYVAEELKNEHFIGNAKMTRSEELMVGPKVRQVSAVRLKVIVTAEEDGTFLECYADGIRRFSYTDGSSEAASINLDELSETQAYVGGNLGYNVCNADVFFDDVVIGRHDYSYYTELYRNQFHFSQFAHWNNDPNGLVYYNGYYHMYYQHNPFANVWGDMYWGHARSTDLMHWENLPICLYPEKGGEAGSWGDGDGYMWSGSALVYHKGESALIESQNWFGDLSAYKTGDGVGLIAFYTRDGAKQDQMIMSSDDGGLTWTKRAYVPSQTLLGLGNDKTDCRDPKVFQYDNNGSTVYGMLLTGMRDPFDVWFLRSYDLVNWQAAGGFKAKVPLVNTTATNGPECPDIAFIEADNGHTKTVLSLAGRGYIVGDLLFQNNRFVLEVDGKDISQMPLNEVPVKQMDFGPDSYATQTFYIDSGEYNGKTVSVSWFSGVPGASASVDSGFFTQLRSRWNCGMTVPVEWGLHFDGVTGEYLLTQTPITKNSDINKKLMAFVTDYEVKAGENVLQNLTASCLEIDAQISNPQCGSVAFRVRVGDSEYTEIGWNETDGYYVDRANTASGNINLPNYAEKYASHTGDGRVLSFYILCDSGSLEVFCDDGAAPFYVITFSNPDSVGMSFSSENDVTFNKLTVNSFSSVWQEKPDNFLNVGHDKIELDTTLCTQKSIVVSAGGKVTYELVSGKNVISFKETEYGLTLYAESAGKAVIKAVCGNAVEYIDVTAYSGCADSDIELTSVNSGNWYVSEEGYIGKVMAGDAFAFSENEGKDFMYSACFDLRSGVAAALVFRAEADMSQYVIVNYDCNDTGNVKGAVKLWSSAGDGAKVHRHLDDLSNVTLTVIAEGKLIKVYLNTEFVLEYRLCDDAPESGLFGLNVCAADVLFKNVSVTENINRDYTSGDVEWNHTDVSAFTVINRNWNNKTVDEGFYSVEGRKITLSQNYIASLPESGKYTFEIRGRNCLYSFDLNVQSVPSAIWQDVELQQDSNAVFFIGNAPSGEVKVNGKTLDGSLYKIEDTQLTVFAAAFSVGENEVSYSNVLHAKVTVKGTPKLEVNFNEGNAGVISTVLFVIIGTVILAEGVLIAVIMLKKGKKDGGNN